MAFSFVQQVSGTRTTAAGSPLSVTITGVTAGNILIAFAGGDDNGGSVTFSDDNSNTWTKPAEGIGNNTIFAIGYVLSANSGDTVVSMSYPTNDARLLFVAEFSCDGTPSYEDFSIGGGTGSADSGDITVDDNWLLLGGLSFIFNGPETFTVDSGWTSVGTGIGAESRVLEAFYDLASTAGVIAFTGSGPTAGHRSGIVAISESGGGGGGTEFPAIRYYQNLLCGV